MFRVAEGLGEAWREGQGCSHLTTCRGVRRRVAPPLAEMQTVVAAKIREADPRRGGALVSFMLLLHI